MSQKNTTAVLIAALQIAIAAHKDGKSVSEAKTAARTKLWENYTAESQSAAERGIENYYNTKASKNPVVPEFAGPVLASEPSLTDAIAALPSKYTKDKLIEIANDFGIKVAKSLTKPKLLEALIAISRQKKAA